MRLAGSLNVVTSTARASRLLASTNQLIPPVRPRGHAPHDRRQLHARPRSRPAAVRRPRRRHRERSPATPRTRRSTSPRQYNVKQYPRPRPRRDRQSARTVDPVSGDHVHEQRGLRDLAVGPRELPRHGRAGLRAQQPKSEVLAQFIGPTVSAVTANSLRQLVGPWVDAFRFELGTAVGERAGVERQPEPPEAVPLRRHGRRREAVRRQSFLSLNTGLCQFDPTLPQARTCSPASAPRSSTDSSRELSTQIAFDPSTAARTCSPAAEHHRRRARRRRTSASRCTTPSASDQERDRHRESGVAPRKTARRPRAARAGRPLRRMRPRVHRAAGPRGGARGEPRARLRRGLRGGRRWNGHGGGRARSPPTPARPRSAFWRAARATLSPAPLGYRFRCSKAVPALLAGDERRVDLGRLDRGGGFSVAAGVGIDAAMIAETPGWLKRRLGVLAYTIMGARAALRTVVGRDFFTARVTVDGVVHERRVAMVMIANVGAVLGERLVLGPEIRPDDGMLDACLFSPNTMRDALTYRAPHGVPRLRLGSMRALRLRAPHSRRDGSAAPLASGRRRDGHDALRRGHRAAGCRLLVPRG